jgi:hypothetical protein
MGSPPVPSQAAPQGQGTQPTINTVQPRAPWVYLQLQFNDPTGTLRDFPQNLPVRVRLSYNGSPPTTYEVNDNLGAGGTLSFELLGPSSQPWQKNFTLLFPGSETEYLVCEPRGATAGATEFTTDVTALSSPPGSPPQAAKRFFRLPGPQGTGPTQIWGLKHSDWATPGGTSNATFTANTGTFSHTWNAPGGAPDIGQQTAPVVLVLDPHWKFFKFQFFDRYYGPTSISSPPRPSHGRRISIPPIVMDGFMVTGSPPPADPYALPVATQSNWTTAGDAKDIAQCLPWMVRWDNSGTNLAPLTGTNMALRFQTDPAQQSCIYSELDTVRSIVNLASTANELKPGPNRLKYYDLPRVWKSRKYYARGLNPGSPPTDGKFFQDLTQADVARADAQATPLIFCLDDIVLTDANRQQLALGATDRVAIFHHRFSKPPTGSPPFAGSPNLSNEGVYTPGTDVKMDGYPYTDITMAVKYYISDLSRLDTPGGRAG